MKAINLLKVNYENHLAFKFDDAPPISNGKIQEWIEHFNQWYLQAADAVGSENSERIISELKRVLEKIFDELVSSSSDQERKLFFHELQKHTNQVLGDDLKNYFRKRTTIKPKPSSQNLIDVFTRQEYFTGKVSEDVVAEILEVAREDIRKFWEKVATGKVKREDLSVNTGESVKRVVSILNREYRKLGVLDALSFCRGEKIVVSGCAIELSVDQAKWWKKTYSEYPEDTQVAYYHYDETLAHPKSILYLTDTTVESGATMAIANTLASREISPMQYLIGRAICQVGNSTESELFKFYRDNDPNSFIPKNKRKHFMALPASMRFNSHFGFDVIPGSEQEKNLLASQVQIEGPAGTFLVFDGSRLLHRGGLVKKGHRIALQIIFSKKESLLEKIKRKLRK